MPSTVGPWFSHTRWGKRTARINVAILIAVVLFLVWKSL